MIEGENHSMEETGSAQEEVVSAETEATVPPSPRNRKPMPSWVLPAGIAVTVLIMLLAIVSLILKGVSSPERAVNKFLSAMENGDFRALSSVAVAEKEDLQLTEENTAPLFRLYEESEQFRADVEESLKEQMESLEDGEESDEDGVVSLRASRKFLHSGYEVVIGTCDTVELGSSLMCTAQLDGGYEVAVAPDNPSADDGWAAAFGPDYYLTMWSNGRIYDLLPGRYTVRASVETSYGETFTAESILDVDNPYGAYGELTFDYTFLDIYNDSSVEADIYIDGQLYGTAPERGDFLIAPIRPETQLEARANVDAGEPMTEQFDASEGYHYLSFVLCEVEIYNAYQAPISIWQGDEILSEIAPGETYTVEGLPSGTVLSAHIYDDAVSESVEYVCQYEQDIFYPEFTVNADVEQSIRTALTAYTDEMLELYNTQNMEGLQASVATGLRTFLVEDLRVNLEESGTGNQLGRESSINRTNSLKLTSMQVGQCNPEVSAEQPVVYVYCDVPLELQAAILYPDGERAYYDGDVTQYLEFTVGLSEGVWSVIA